MESQDQDSTTWDTRSRRPTLFYQGGGAAGPPSLAARKEEHTFTYEGVYYRPCLVRKKAVCDFRVRWPELVLLDQKKKEEGLPLIGHSTSDKQVYEASACSSEVSISNVDLESNPSEGLDSTVGSAASSQPPPTEPVHKTIFNRYLRPESMTRLEKRVRRRTVAAMNELGQEIEAVKSRRSVLMMNIKDLKKEMAWEEEAKPFLECLRQKEKESLRKYDALWKDYIRECREVNDRRRELASAFDSSTADLQKQLLQSRKTEVGFRRKLMALGPVAQVKESQDQKIQALELEEASIVADIPLMDREAHFQFLEERAALEKQVEELNLLESGENITRELKKKARALEAVAKQAHKAFCQGINAENRRLRTQLQQLDLEFHELETRKEELEQKKQHWKEQQWYLEALARGRQRLQRREYGPHKPQAAPRPTRGRLLGPRPKTNPK